MEIQSLQSRLASLEAAILDDDVSKGYVDSAGKALPREEITAAQERRRKLDLGPAAKALWKESTQHGVGSYSWLGCITARV